MKKFLAIFLTACMCFSLAACGSDGNPSGTEGGSDNEQKTPLGEHSHVYTTKSKCDLCGEEWHATETDAFTFTPVLIDGVEGYDVMFGEYQEVIFTYDENGLPIQGDNITKGKPYEKEEIVFPCVHNGKPVISVGRFNPCKSETVKKITIPDSIISFSDFISTGSNHPYGAFARCPVLEEIVFPYEPNLGSIASSDASPIAYYSLFGELETPSPITKHDTDGALYIGDYLINVESVTGHTFTVREGTKGIAASACRDLEDVEEVFIPDSVKEIGDGAFSFPYVILGEHESPKKVVFGENSNLKRIDREAFNGCWSLTEINFPEGLETIGGEAFERCISLSEIRIPDSVRRVGLNAFLDTAYESENIRSSLYEYNIQGDEVYNGNCLVKVNPDFEGHYTVREGTTAIAGGAFSGCLGVTSVTLPEDLTAIEAGLFVGCAIESIELPKSVKSIGASAFEGCQFLTSITIPEGVTEIGMWAFRGCDSLNSITIPEGVTEIEASAFGSCEAMKKIVLPRSLRGLGWGALDSSGLTEIEFRGTVDEWFDIIVKEGYNQKTIRDVGLNYVISSEADYTIVCTDGTIAKDGTVTRK